MRKKKVIRKLTITGPGRSYYVTLPIGIIRKLKWRKGQRLVVKQSGKCIVIKDFRL